jgi:hypothetical protein
MPRGRVKKVRCFAEATVMPSLSRIAAVVLVGLLAGLWARGSEGPDKKAATKKTVGFPPPAGDKPAPEANPYVPLGTLAGVVRNAADSAGGLNLRVTVRYLEPNVPAQQKYLRQQQQLLVRQRQILTNPNPAQAQQQMQDLLRDAERLMQSQKDLFHVKSVDKDVELDLAEGVKVRARQPVQQFDDKGNIKRYTPQELKELRGDGSLPGYAAELSDLQPGQTVLVKVVRLKPAKPADTPPADKPAAAGSQASAAEAKPGPSGDKAIATLILIVKD